MSTYGEELVAGLLKSLPGSEYEYFIEPTITHTRSVFRNPDFVIVSRSLGVLILEVKDWKRIIRAARDETDIERNNGLIETERNPVNIARQYALNLSDRFQELEELLQKRRGKTKLKFPWMYAVVLPHIEKRVIEQCETVWGKGFVIGKESLTPKRFEKTLQSLCWPWKLEQPLEAKTIEVIRGVLDPTVVISNPDGETVGVFTDDQLRLVRESVKKPNAVKTRRLLSLELLSHESVKVAESTSVRLVRGVAGSGKSLILAHRAQYLAEKHPELSILVLAFNKDLVADLRRRIPGAQNIEIINFHRLCRQILGKSWREPLNIEGWINNRFPNLETESGLESEYVTTEIEWRKELKLDDNAAYLSTDRSGRGRSLTKAKREIVNRIYDQYRQYHDTQKAMDWADVPFLTLAQLHSGHAMQQSYDVILIDEAQDFTPSWIAVVKALLKPNGSFFLCDDPSQSLFWSFNWKEKGIDITGRRTHILRVPFRCTREITAAAHSLLVADKLISQQEDTVAPDLNTYELEEGALPTLTRCMNQNDEVRLIEAKALQSLASGVAPQQVAILCHNRNYVRYWAHLREKGFYVESFNKMKGLEFHTVLLPYLHTSFNNPDKTIDDTFISDIRRRIFTAMTRARENLIMSYQENLPPALSPIEPYVQRESGAVVNGRVK